MKKAQGLSLNTIVIGAVVLIVLIVVVGIFTGYFNKFVPGLVSASEQSCSAEHGFEVSDECDPETQRQVYGNFDDEEVPPGKVCCEFVRTAYSCIDEYSRGYYCTFEDLNRFGASCTECPGACKDGECV